MLLCYGNVVICSCLKRGGANAKKTKVGCKNEKWWKCVKDVVPSWLVDTKKPDLLVKITMVISIPVIPAITTLIPYKKPLWTPYYHYHSMAWVRFRPFHSIQAFWNSKQWWERKTSGSGGLGWWSCTGGVDVKKVVYMVYMILLVVQKSGKLTSWGW